MKSVRIRSLSGPYFPAFGLNTEIYSVNLRIQSTPFSPNAAKDGLEISSEEISMLEILMFTEASRS